MSVFEGNYYRDKEQGVVHLFEQPHILVSYGLRPLFKIEQRFVRNPQTDAQKKDCDSYIAFPLFNDSIVLLDSYTRYVKSFMDKLEKWFPEAYQMSPRAIMTNGLTFRTKTMTYTTPMMIQFKANEVSSTIYSFLMYYVLLTINSFTGSLNTFFTRTLLNPLTKSPKIDAAMEPFYSWFVLLCLFYQGYLIKRPSEEPRSPAFHYQQMHVDEVRVPIVGDEEEMVVQRVEEEEVVQEDVREEEEVVVQEEVAEEEDVEEEEEEESDAQNESSEENDSEEFIQCERLERSEEEQEEEEDEEKDNTQRQLKVLMAQKEAMGHDIDTEEHYIRLNDTYELQTYSNATPILAVQWPSEHGTKRVAIHCSKYFPALLLGTILNGVLMPLAITFVARCFFSVLFSSALLQIPFHLLYTISGNYWLAKQTLILCVQLFQSRYNPATKNQQQNAAVILQVATRNVLVAFFVSMIVPSFHNWSILDTLHFYWILRFFRII